MFLTSAPVASFTCYESVYWLPKQNECRIYLQDVK